MAQDSETVLVKSVLKLSGFEKTTSQLPETFSANLNKIFQKKPNPYASELTDAFKVAFKPDAFYQDMVTHFKLHFNKAYLGQLQKQFNLPLYKKMIEIETSASSPDSSEKLFEFLSTIKETPPSKARVLLIEKMDTMSGLSNLATQIMIRTTQVTLIALNSQQPEDKKMSEADIQRFCESESFVSQTTDQAKEMVTTTLLFYYQSVEDKTLEDYIKQSDTPAIKWFIENSKLSFSHSFEKALEVFKAELSRISISK